MARCATLVAFFGRSSWVPSNPNPTVPKKALRLLQVAHYFLQRRGCELLGDDLPRFSHPCRTEDLSVFEWLGFSMPALR